MATSPAFRAGTPARNPFTPEDRRYMYEALALAARAGYRTHPNPQVGCVLVQGGEVVGRGYHRRRGEPHAEALALREAGPRARGATAYVTLEPCAHHGLTPPCADALVAAGVARVVAAMEDPDPRVRGRGFARLRQAGVRVDVGLLAEHAERLNRPWLHYKRTGRPYVLVKVATSLDGRIATRTGESRWISSEAARQEVHQVRDQSDAILIGLGTLLADDPRLTARAVRPGPLAFGWGLPRRLRNAPADAAPEDDPWQPRQPLRIVVDSHARTPSWARLFPAIVAVTPAAPADRIRELEAAGAEMLVLPPGPDGRVDLEALLAELGRREVVSVLAEGGGQLLGALLDRHLADGARLYLSPLFLGGGGAAAVGGEGAAHLAEVPRLARPYTRRLGRDLVVEGDIVYPTARGRQNCSPASSRARAP